jgi:WD40 repeat protein
VDAPELWGRLSESSRLALGYAAAYEQIVEFDSKDQTQQKAFPDSSISAVPEIHSENLLRGILDSHPGYSGPQQLLEHLGLSRNALEESLSKASGFISGEHPKEPIRLAGMPELSWDSRIILDEGLKLAEEFSREKEKIVHLRHLFGGILFVDESVAHQSLATLLSTSTISIAQVHDSYPEFLAGDPSLSYKEFLERRLPLTPEKTIDTSLDTLPGRELHVRALAVTPNGRYVISGSDDKTLKVWDLESYKEIAILPGHEDVVHTVAITMDGHRAVSGSDDKTLKVWDLESYKEITTLGRHEGAINALAVTPDGRRVISGSNDKTLKIWNLESYKEIITIDGHEGSVNALAVTPDGRRVISGSAGMLKVWNLESFKEITTLSRHEGVINALAVTPDGRYAISGSDRTLKVWDLKSYKEMTTLSGHEGLVNALAVTRDGRLTISGSDDKTLRVWNLESYKEITALIGHEERVRAVAVTPDGRRVISGSFEGAIKVWDITKFMPPQLSATVLDDRPLNEEDIQGPDPLNYSAYAAAIFQLIMKNDTGLPISLAISAPWGYGKTSIMNWVKTELDNHRLGKKHECKMVPDFPGSPTWPESKVENHSNPAAVRVEEYASGLGLVRCCKTVWIDAWRYESSAALWAAFTKEIYQQGQRQLGGRLERLKFRLNLANSASYKPSGSWLRIGWAVFRNNYGKVVSVLIAGIVIGFGFYLGLENISKAEDILNSFTAIIAGLIGSIGGFIVWVKGLVRQPFSFNLDKVTAASVERPEPVDKVNAPCDIERLIELLAPGKEDALVVFVDDLDRCSPDKIKDTIEAINLLFHGSKEGKTIFVLGMDEVMVAASLHVAYSEMIKELERRQHPAGADFGHRFLGKICQISFNLPEPQPTAMEDYLGSLIEAPGGPELAGTQEVATVKPTVITAERKQEINAAVSGKRNIAESLKAVEEVVKKAPEEERQAVAEAALERAKGESLKKFSKDSPEMQEAILDGVRFLPPGPRDYKRFINAVRLQLLVSYQIRTFDSKRKWAENDQIAKWTALCIRWPVLAEELRKHRGLLQDIENWANKKKNLAPPEHWQKRVKDLAADSDFKKVFQEKPLLGDADLHGLLIVQ